MAVVEEATDFGEAIACGRQAEVFQYRCCGREVLHGSAVHLPWGILCICGASGVGKSTLAVALSRHGYEIVADDDILLCEEAGTQRLLPNYLGSRLTKGSADLLGLKQQELSTDFPGSDKRIWLESSWMPRFLPEAETHSIWGIVILEADNGCHTAFERAKDTAAFEVLWRQLKYPWIACPIGAEAVWRDREPVNHCAVFRWKRKPAAAAPHVTARNLLDLISARQGSLEAVAAVASQAQASRLERPSLYASMLRRPLSGPVSRWIRRSCRGICLSNISSLTEIRAMERVERVAAHESRWRSNGAGPSVERRVLTRPDNGLYDALNTGLTMAEAT